MDELGRLIQVELFEAANDDEAVQVAHRKRLNVNREVWDRGRFVAAIPVRSELPVRRFG